MDILFLPVGTAGDVLPHLALARTMAARGHRVRVAANPLFLTPTPGVELVPLGTADEFLHLLSDPDLWHPWRSTAKLLHSVGELAEVQYELAADNGQRGGLTIGGSLALGARCAEEAHGIPYATLHLQPVALWNPLDPPLVPGLMAPSWLPRSLVRVQMWIAERVVTDPLLNRALGPLRKRLGLPKAKRFMHWWHADGLSLALFPSWFAAAESGSHVRHTGFPLWTDSAALPPELEQFLAQGSPPVVITPGSGQRHAHRELSALIAAVQQLGRRGVVLTRFREHLPADLPDGVIHVPWAPLSTLLPRAAALVHHGGVGTTAHGLAAGVPQFILPRAYDQPDNAARVERLGGGLHLNAARVTSERAIAVLERLLNDQRISAACAGLRERIAAEDGLYAATNALETYGSTR